MDKKEIIEKLENGEYGITGQEDCGCRINWEIDSNGELVSDIDSDCCYESNTLSVGGEDIYEYIRYEGGRMLTDKIDRDDIDDNIIDRVKRGLGEMRERGDSGNCKRHDDNVREALVDYLMDCGYELDRDDCRGFANEYSMILRDTGSPVENTQEDCEEWADQFLYAGNASTEAFNGFHFEQEEADNE